AQAPGGAREVVEHRRARERGRRGGRRGGRNLVRLRALGDAVDRGHAVEVLRAVDRGAVVVRGDVADRLEERLAPRGGAAVDLVVGDRRAAVGGSGPGQVDRVVAGQGGERRRRGR